MGNSPGGSSRQRYSDFCVRAHKAVSKMQLLQNHLKQDEINQVEASGLALEKLADMFTNKYFYIFICL